MKIVDFIIEKLSGPSPKESEKKMETSGFTLVVGATGGVGRRVVGNLRKKGLPVKALVSFITFIMHFLKIKIMNLYVFEFLEECPC